VYANLTNPPGTDIQALAPCLETSVHLYRLSRLSRLVLLIGRAQQRLEYSRHRYDSFSLCSSPFVTRDALAEDLRRWSYIAWRLERYYLKKVCELNSAAYRAVARDQLIG